MSLKSILVSLLLVFFSEKSFGTQLDAYTEVPAPGLDKYGGYKEIQLGATGFFRIQKTAERFWLVSPEGHAFLSHGINHLEPKWMKRFYNIDYWARAYKVVDYSDNTFKEAFIKKVKDDIKALGWNTLGCHSPNNLYEKRFIPYVETVRFVNIQHYRPHDADDFPDVFSSEFERYVDSIAAVKVRPLRNDPYLLGYFMTDCPILTPKDAEAHGNNIYGKARKASPTWPEVLRNLSGNSLGKKAYLAHIKELYNHNIEDFNKTYKTDFGHFDHLLKSVDWRLKSDPKNESEQRDNHSFLLKILERRYALETAAIKKYDPNHLIFGDKFNGNTDTPESILKVASNYFDVIFIQHYALWDELKTFMDKIARTTGKPIIQGDSSVQVPYENMPNPYGPHSTDQKERIARVENLYMNSFARPDFLGWHWCGWMDSWEIGGQIGKQHGGIQDPFGNFHPVKDFLSAFSRKMYCIATKAK